jgi:hypothetical protein
MIYINIITPRDTKIAFGINGATADVNTSNLYP